jgi:iron complex outermembrane recepter protein
MLSGGTASTRHTIEPIFVALGIAFIFSFFSLGAGAQTPRTTITGRVLDSTGASLTGAAVTLKMKGSDQERAVSTGETGDFRFDDLIPGEYQINATSKGFAAASQNMRLITGESREVEIRLQPAGAREAVTVMAEDYQVENATTATKTDAPLVETPQSISVITRDRLDAQGVNGLAQALRYTAGVQGEPFGFDPRFTSLMIRGFDASDTGLYRDGLQLRNPGFAVSFNLEPYGVERIEVLKGPASVLYGQGSPGGLVNLVSKRPTQVSFRELEFTPGNFGHMQGKLDLGGPIDEAGVFSYRLSGLLRNSNTQVDFVQNDRRFVAPAFTWRPRNDTTLTLLSHYQHDKTRASQALPADGTLYANSNGRIPVTRFTGEPGVDRYNRTEYSIGYLFEHRASDAWTIRHSLRHYANDLDHATIYSSALRADQRTLDRLIFASDGELDGFAVDNQAQVKFATGTLSHSLLGGVDYQHADVGAVQSFGAAPPVDVFNPVYGAAVPTPTVFNDADTAQQQIGLYLQDQIKINKRWGLSLAGRYDWAGTRTVNNLGGTITDQNDKKFTGRAGLVYLSDIGLAPYFSYSQSFLPALGADTSGVPFKPETGRQYEIGVKYQPPGRNSFLTLALFDLTRRNFLQLNPATFLQVQTGEVRSRGIEMEGVADLGFGLNLIANYTYLDAEITKSIVPGEEGARPTQVPKHMASLWADYRIRKGVLNRLGFGAGVRYLGSTFGDTPNTFKSPDATLADAAIHYDWKNFRFAVNAENVFNREYIASTFIRGGNFVTFGPARTARTSIRFRW